MANWHTSHRRALRKLRHQRHSLPHLANYLLENFGLGQISKMDAVRAATDTVLDSYGYGRPHDPNGGMGTKYRQDVNTMPVFLQDTANALHGYALDPNAIPIPGAIKATLIGLQVMIWKAATP